MSLFNSIKSLFGNQVDYQELIKNGAVVIDVRTPGEFASGHATGSKNIPLDNFKSKMSSLKGKEVILVCRSGARAGRAKSMLKSEGITAHNAGAWQNVESN